MQAQTRSIDAPTWLRPARLAHRVMIAAAILWTIYAVSSRVPAPYEPPTPLWVVFFWVMSFLLMGYAPSWPATGLILYGMLATVIARYEPGVDIALNVDVLGWIAVLSVTGSVVWMIQQDRKPAIPRRWLTWILFIFIGWMILSGVVAVFRDGAWRPAPEHHPHQFWQVLVLFLLASQFLGDRLASVALAAVITLSLSIRGRFLSPFGVYLQEDIASLLVIALPLAILSVWQAEALVVPLDLKKAGHRTAAKWWIRAVMLLMIANMLRLLQASQNRGAAVGLVAVLAAMWLMTRYKWLTALIGLPALVVVALGMRTSGYWGRFTDLWTGGRESGSAQVRFEIWRTGWKMFLDHPLFGVGPGNFPEALGRYDRRLRGASAHSHVINMLAETGVIGAVLFLMVFVGALIVLAQVVGIARRDWPAPAARLVFASICGYLAIGTFITRHDLVLAYILAGWSVGLYNRLAGPDLFPDTRGQRPHTPTPAPTPHPVRQP